MAEIAFVHFEKYVKKESYYSVLLLHTVKKKSKDNFLAHRYTSLKK